MNHRLKFRWEADYGLALADVWCPGDHGGTCNLPEVDPGLCADDCPILLVGSPGTEGEDLSCTCGGYQPTDECWAKEHLNEFVYNGDGWPDVLRGSIDLPWVAVEIDSCGPDGNDPIEVRVIAELEDK